MTRTSHASQQMQLLRLVARRTRHEEARAGIAGSGRAARREHRPEQRGMAWRLAWALARATRLVRTPHRGRSAGVRRPARLLPAALCVRAPARGRDVAASRLCPGSAILVLLSEPGGL